ncbi:hypothetical protein TcWFU_001020 [Taenia crassiceps]
MEPFIGTWKLEKSESFDPIMERLKVDPELRKMGNSLKPVMVIGDLGGGKYSVRVETPVKSFGTTFKLGEKYDDISPDSRQVTSLFTLEGGVLKQEQTDKERTVYIDRVVEGNELKMTIKVDELVCVRIYVKEA